MDINTKTKSNCRRPICDLVQCNAGDTIDLRYSQNSGGTLSFTSISDRIWVSILRVGN